MKKFKKILSNNIFVLGLLIKYIPIYVIVSVILYIAKGLLQSLSNVWLLERVIDGISESTSYTKIIYPVIFYCTYALIVGIFNALFTEVFEKIYKQKFSNKIRLILYKKTTECDIAQYDNVDFYDDFIWAAKECDNCSFKVFQNTLLIVHRLTVVTSTIAMISQINKIIFVVVLLSCVMNSVFSAIQNNARFQLEQLCVPLLKRKAYVERTIHLPDYAKEFRTSNIGCVLFSMYNRSVDEIKKLTLDKSKKMIRYDFAKKIFGEEVFITLFSIIILSYNVLNDDMSMGAFVAAYNGIQVVHTSLSFFLGRIVLFSEHSLHIDKLKTLWFYKPLITTKKNNAVMPIETKTIRLDRVSFSYNKGKNKTLSDIKLCLNKNKKIAIVGPNGAGKTTMAKLLLRLYDADEGTIYHNDIDLKELDLFAYRDRFSCLFQNYNIFDCSLGENISMSDQKFLDVEKAENAIKNSGFYGKYKYLPDKLETILNKEFCENGILLSGGERQKVAIARVLYKSADCYILDEPTSALDPESEYEFNRTIMQHSKDKLLIVISHRLTITKDVDEIIVLKDGRICEIGNHEQLMNNNSVYSNLFNIQAHKYQLNNKGFP